MEGKGGYSVFIYRRVRDLREDHDKTQKEIAAVLNMQLTVYQRYERGERELPLWAAIKLADYYHVTLDYLVERES
ncbi:MAG: helix-turn-helix transcriptional regulator [Clostridia bacterium]|nr:helix-turn-helix transcriptional regulator [Clostridia bacterium]